MAFEHGFRGIEVGNGAGHFEYAVVGTGRKVEAVHGAFKHGGTVGIGSIVGVGLGISLGGAGSVFWMWVCGLVTAAIKYAEVYIAVARRRRDGDGFVGGTMYCLDDAGRHGTSVRRRGLAQGRPH